MRPEILKRVPREISGSGKSHGSRAQQRASDRECAGVTEYPREEVHESRQRESSSFNRVTRDIDVLVDKRPYQKSS